jgi:hypothetical protein
MADAPMFAVERRRPQPGLRLVRGTNLAYGSVRQWVALVYQVGGPVRCSSPHYNRCALLYRSLGAADLRICRDLGALEACEDLFDRARSPCDAPAGWGLQRELSRADLGACWSRPETGSPRCARAGPIAMHDRRARASIPADCPTARSSG